MVADTERRLLLRASWALAALIGVLLGLMGTSLVVTPTASASPSVEAGARLPSPVHGPWSHTYDTPALFTSSVGATGARQPQSASLIARPSVGGGKSPVLTRGCCNAAKTGDGLLSPGPYAGRSIPGDSTRKWTRGQRDEINDIMRETGCHRCGTRDPGTKSGDAIPDHQPPLSQSDGPYELYPHCKTCSWDQLQAIARLRRGGQ